MSTSLLYWGRGARMKIGRLNLARKAIFLKALCDDLHLHFKNIKGFFYTAGAGIKGRHTDKPNPSTLLYQKCMLSCFTIEGLYCFHDKI